MKPSIALFCHSPHLQDYAQELSDIFSVELFSNESSQASFDFVILLDEQGVKLRARQYPNFSPLYLDFSSGKMAFRAERFRHEAILKAVAANKYHTVVDATAGLGRDSVIMAAAGMQVTMLEKSAVVCCLLYDALKRWADVDADDSGTLLKLRHCDALHYFRDSAQEELADVIYLDPMFPGRKKSALVKKEMQIFHALLAEDESDDGLLEQAMERAAKRVVVKRPIKSNYLQDIKPSHQISTKTIRFDVYVIAS